MDTKIIHRDLLNEGVISQMQVAVRYPPRHDIIGYVYVTRDTEIVTCQVNKSERVTGRDLLDWPGDKTDKIVFKKFCVTFYFL